MTSIRDGVIDAVGQGLCNITTGSGLLAQLGSSLWRSAGVDSIADKGAALANGFGAASDLFCGREPRDISSQGAPPFTGGQCPGTQYAIDVNWRENGQVLGSNRSLGVGPLGVNVVPVLTVEDGPFGTQYRIQDGTGQLYRISQKVITDLTFNVRPTNGPDDCGDLPGDPPQFEPSNFNPTLPVSYDDNDGNPQSIDIDVQYGPGDLTVENEFNVPFSVQFSPGVQINGNINLNTGDINIGGGGSGGGPEEIPESEPVPEGSSLVGLRIVWDAASLNGTRATSRNDTPGGPVIYVPRLAAVRFQYEAPGGAGWGPSVSAQSMESVIWAERPALDYDIELNGGGAPMVRKIVMSPSRFFTGATPE